MSEQRRVDWNRLSDHQHFNGWRFDAVVKRLALLAAEQFGQCSCRDQRVCIHAAAAALHGIIRIVEHPRDRMEPES